MSSYENSGNKDLDWENRVLCSDESCIGVIGPDGRCKECGKPYQGELPQSFPNSPAAPATSPPSAEPANSQTEHPDSTEAAIDQAAPEDADEEWAKRKLCSDESCIGVIGPDGRCKECGRPFEG